MKNFICFLVFLSAILISGCRQKSEVVTSSPDDVAKAVEVFIKGIVDADADLLEGISAEELMYSHSNGRTQNKADFIAEIINPGGLDFLRIDLEDQTIKVVGETAIVRHTLVADTVRGSGATGLFVVGNLLVWQNQQGQWKLLARQSYRLPGR